MFCWCYYWSHRPVSFPTRVNLFVVKKTLQSEKETFRQRDGKNGSSHANQGRTADLLGSWTVNEDNFAERMVSYCLPPYMKKRMLLIENNPSADVSHPTEKVLGAGRKTLLSAWEVILLAWACQLLCTFMDMSFKVLTLSQRRETSSFGLIGNDLFMLYGMVVLVLVFRPINSTMVHQEFGGYFLFQSRLDAGFSCCDFKVLKVLFGSRFQADCYSISGVLTERASLELEVTKRDKQSVGFIPDNRYAVSNGSGYAVLISWIEYDVLDRELDTPYPVEVDTPYSAVDQNNVFKKNN
ncbi:hypothetical protein Tco_0256813 [Tanacetum coccineum]